MSRAISYYDWELSYHSSNKEESSEKERDNQTSIGISKKTLKNYLEKWKKENF